MLTLILSAMATVPTHGDGLLSVGTGAIDRMSWSSDGEVAVGRDRESGKAIVVQLDSWQVDELEPCPVTSVTTVPFLDIQEIYVGCNDSRVFLYELSEGEITQPSDDDGTAVFWQLQDDVFADVADPIQGLFWNLDETDPMLLMHRAAADAGYVHTLALNDGAQDADVFAGWPLLAAGSAYVEGVVDAGNLYFYHGDRKTTIVGLTSGSASFTPTVAGVTFSMDDVTAGNGRLWGVDSGSDALMQFAPLQGTFTPAGYDLGSPTTLGRYAGTDEDWMLVHGEATRIYTLTGTTVGLTTPTFEDLAPANTLIDVLAGPDFTLAGTSAGEIQVFSARPWVDTVSLEPATGESGTAVEVSFRVSEASDWSVFLNGDRTGSGTLLGSGETTTDDETATLSVTVTDEWLEGDNKIYVLAEGNNLLPGHARSVFVIDTPPETPVLQEGDVAFAPSRLELTFDGIADADVDHYDVYVSDEPFEPADYPTGGPTSIVDGPENPTVVDGDPDARTSASLSPLVNGTLYYIAVRAIDESGQESALSNVVTGTPEPVVLASDLAGEMGGSSCATSPVGGVGAIVLGLLALTRRFRPVAVAGLLASSPAVAGDRVPTGDMSPQVGNFEIRYGPFIKMDDTSITDIYGETGHELLQVEFGPQITRFFELDLQFGFYQELAKGQSQSGEESDVKTMLTYYPLGTSVSARLHILDEQIVVPFVRLGMDYVYFNQLSDNEDGGKDRISGAKVGHHYAIGANVLLDTFARGRASLLEAQTGINDTYLTFEYRRQNIDARKTPWAGAVNEGFDLSGDLFSVGLKLDY